MRDILLFFTLLFLSYEVDSFFYTNIAEDPEKEINTTEEKEKIIEEVEEEGADPVNTTNNTLDKNTSIISDNNETAVPAEDENLICSCPLCCCVCSCIKSISR